MNSLISAVLPTVRVLRTTLLFFYTMSKKKSQKRQVPEGAVSLYVGQAIIGRLFEGWTASIFGGIRTKMNSNEKFNPDVIVGEERFLLESKGWSIRGRAKLWVEQTAKYKRLADDEGWEAYYCIYRHGVYGYAAKSMATRQSHGYFFNEREMLNALIETAGQLVVLPIWIVDELCRIIGTKSYTNWCYAHGTELLELPVSIWREEATITPFLQEHLDVEHTVFETKCSSLMGFQLPPIPAVVYGLNGDVDKVFRRLSKVRMMVGPEFMFTPEPEPGPQVEQDPEDIPF